MIYAADSGIYLLTAGKDVVRDTVAPTTPLLLNSTNDLKTIIKVVQHFMFCIASLPML